MNFKILTIVIISLASFFSYEIIKNKFKSFSSWLEKRPYVEKVVLLAAFAIIVFTILDTKYHYAEKIFVENTPGRGTKQTNESTTTIVTEPPKENQTPYVNTTPKPFQGKAVENEKPNPDTKTIPASNTTVDEIINFGNPVVEDVIRKQINKAEGPIRASDVNKINSLCVCFDFGNKDYDSMDVDLSFLKYMKNLSDLIIGRQGLKGHCRWVNLNSIGCLTNLQRLVLIHDFNDLSFLKENKQLPWLDISYCDNINITSLRSLTNLRELDLANDGITDISPIKNSTSLITLRLNDNGITDISPLKDLINLQSLYLGGNRITDISTLKGLTNLGTLSLCNNEITDVSPLKNLGKLEHLYLHMNPINDITPIIPIYSNLIDNGLKGRDFIIDLNTGKYEYTEN